MKIVVKWKMKKKCRKDKNYQNRKISNFRQEIKNKINVGTARVQINFVEILRQNEIK